MWVLLALVLLAPLAWALLGADVIGSVLPRVAEWLPAWLAEPTAADVRTVAIAAALGFALSVTMGRRTVMHLSTLVHEIGHVLTGALLGGTVDRIRTHPDGSGTAHFERSVHGVGRGLAVSFAGYVAPGLVGVASVQAALAGYGTFWTVYFVTLVAIMLLLTLRTGWAALVALSVGLAGWALIHWGTTWAVTFAVAGVAGGLLGSGVRDTLNQWRVCRRSEHNDASHMAVATGWPVRLFAGTHVVVAIGLAVVGIALPLRDLGLV